MKRYLFTAGIIFCLFLCVHITGCAQRQPGMVRDIHVLPQDALHYLDEPAQKLISPARQAELYEEFLVRFFSPWNRDKAMFGPQEVFRGLGWYQSRDIFGENNLPLPHGWIHEMREKSNTSGYPLLQSPGITVVHASMRVLPTHKPVFFNPYLPGEGFPFDYMQNTLIPAGTPLLVTHASSDGEWVLAETDFAAGWIRQQELARVDSEFIRYYQEQILAGFITDGTPVRCMQGEFLVTGRVGMVLPMTRDQEHDDLWKVFVPARDHQGFARIIPATVSKKDCLKMPFPPEPDILAHILNSMMGQAYGWGGLYENRDCSALIKDIFTGLGIFLPRNSRAQAQAGHFISMDGLSAQEKKDMIAKLGKPWMTILYMPGHVMLYLGQDPVSRQAVVYHSIWGLRTWHPFQRQQGRWIIGRTVITSLEPGKEMTSLVRPQGLLVERISGMVLLN